MHRNLISNRMMMMIDTSIKDLIAMLATEPSSPAVINMYFHGSLLLLFLSGIVLFAIDGLMKSRINRYNASMTKALWRFVPQKDIRAMEIHQCWNWRKLFSAGMMISCAILSVCIKATYNARYSVIISTTVFLLWTLFINIYWYYILPRQQKHDSRITDITTATTASDSISTESNKKSGWDYRKIINKDNLDEKVDNRLPVTVVTGYLGSGKTTLVKQILENTLGMKILVIENEIGLEGIDHDLLVKHTVKEDIILMNNGCVCCTVRKDLIVAFRQLFEKDAFAKLDWIVIETTGIANPAPLIQSLYMDLQCSAHMRLDSIVTVADCKHIPMHIHEHNSGNSDVKGAHGGISEAIQQLIFADIILLNKTDLVAGPEAVKQIISSCILPYNSTAEIYPCTNSDVPLDKILNRKAFDPLKNKAVLEAIDKGATLFPLDKATGKLKKGSTVRRTNIKDALMGNGDANRIKTISLVCDDGDLDLDQFNKWVMLLLREKGEYLYRMKGILAMHGYDEQFMVQGVHMIFDGTRGSSWSTSKRRSKLVLIGRNLDEQGLKKDFLSCRYQHQK